MIFLGGRICLFCEMFLRNNLGKRFLKRKMCFLAKDRQFCKIDLKTNKETLEFQNKFEDTCHQSRIKCTKVLCYSMLRLWGHNI